MTAKSATPIDDSQSESTDEEGLESKIVAHLLKTGYPLELDVASILEERGWIVTSNTPFFDVDEEKHRECDICAVRVRRVTLQDETAEPSFANLGHGLVSVLAIECKKSEKPWVFFTRTAGNASHNQIRYVSKISNLVTFVDTPQTVLSPGVMARHLWYFPLATRSRNFTEAFKSDSQTSQIWTALNQVVKALRHFQAQYDQPYMRHLTTFLVPVIVLDGVMFEATLRKGDISLQRSNHVAVEFDIVSRPDPLVAQQVLVDVITRDYLLDYIEKVDRGFDGIRQELEDAFKNGSAKIEDV
ncbi:MAG TPA: hypothetical protein VIP09_11270 [Dehalococcoidia bacterium]|jgi:hypothetical protein